jgi:carbamate kinase
MSKKLAIIAVGGNSLILDDKHQTVADQYRAVVETTRNIAGIIEMGYRVVVTHGNGPQVGFILRRSELSRSELHEVPLDSCVADTEGSIGYHIQQAMRNQMRGWQNPPPVATVVTQVLVDRGDPSFKSPSKPIGSFMDQRLAMAHKEQDRWDVVEDAGRGWRRVVASPKPVKIIELAAIKKLLDSEMVVIAAGGGGIPVVENENGELTGAAAVIDKDLATSLLARELKANLLVISTAVEKVAINYKKPGQRDLDRITLAEAKRYLADGQFAPGSMRPKVEAVIQFLQEGGSEALITDPPHLVQAFQHKAGTWIVP